MKKRCTHTHTHIMMMIRAGVELLRVQWELQPPQIVGVLYRNCNYITLFLHNKILVATIWTAHNLKTESQFCMRLGVREPMYLTLKGPSMSSLGVLKFNLRQAPYGPQVHQLINPWLISLNYSGECKALIHVKSSRWGMYSNKRQVSRASAVPCLKELRSPTQDWQSQVLYKIPNPSHNLKHF